ncbi:MAG: MalY/PatB family protein [Clostridia bacterium]|nr:MalY/PatB family protein [Clostridia bacterium]
MLFDEAYFDAGLDRRGTDCVKWDGLAREHGEDILPMWVADMDFPSPPAVAEAIAERAKHPTYGYTEVTDGDWQAPIDFWRRRHGLTIRREEMQLLPCVVTGIKVAIRACTEEKDGVVIMPPVYHPFAASVKATGRTLVNCPLIKDDDGRYTMDEASLEAAFAAGARAVVLCNPHNPVGRAWTAEELTRLCDMAKRHQVTVISDEIHADFVFDGRKHVSALSIMRENVIMLCAASKTFNTAGLQQSLCVCPDAALRERVAKVIAGTGITSGNVFALAGTRAAYEHGDAWLDGLVPYLEGNRNALAEAVSELLPGAVLTPLEATYLCWLDVSAYGLSDGEVKARCLKHGVYFNDGSIFGREGAGFVRINIGCPRRYIREGILRLKKALEE